jgi:hypothetical protein
VILYAHTSHNGFLSVASNKFMLPFVIGEGC